MKLATKIILGLSILVFFALGIWGAVFYFSFMSELTGEIDDTLADYSNDIIVWSLAGEPLPYSDAVAYNTFDIKEVTPEYAAANNRIRYWESITYIQSQDEDVPARNRSCIFKDADDRYYELVVSVPTIERDSVSEHIIKWTIILYIVLLLAIIGIALTVVRRNLRPLDELLQWLDAYSRGEKPGSVPTDRHVVEFRKLSMATQEAVDRLESRNEEQKAFIGNVSHELQTPLAVCTGRIESLLSDTELTETQTVELMKLARSLRDLSRLNKTLLMLHRIDNDRFPESERIAFLQLINESIGLYSEIYASRNISVSVRTDAPFIYEMNPQLAKMLVNNLIKNIFVHSGSGSAAEVSVSASGFTVSNPGDGPLDSGLVFSRFYRKSSDKDGSTGLGLALAYSICRSHSLTLSYNWADGRHCFTVSASSVSPSTSSGQNILPEIK